MNNLLSNIGITNSNEAKSPAPSIPGAGFTPAGWIVKPHGSGPQGTVVNCVVVETVTVV